MGMGIRGARYMTGVVAGSTGAYVIDNFFIKKDSFKDKLRPVNEFFLKKKEDDKAEN
jgi:hypothetical protein